MNKERRAVTGKVELNGTLEALRYDLTMIFAQNREAEVGHEETLSRIKYRLITAGILDRNFFQ